MQYSPKLKRVMEEIKAILKKEDIAGVVVLHNIEGPAQVTKESVHVRGFTEFLYHINTSYSAAKFEGDRFKVKGKSIHYPSKEVRDIQLAGTVNLLDHLSTNTGKISLQLMDLYKMVSGMVERLDDGDSNFSSHTAQNN